MAAIHEPHPLPTQIIDEEGILDVAALERFVSEVRLAECGNGYVVVSIMGPQSGGKSTLLNRCFGTSFREMDSLQGRSQTTKGIWIAKAAGIDPCTLVLDLEGSDGRERGEDDTAFEKQSAIFAVVVSDILLINMWYNDIGRERAAGKPLLRTMFQVMMQLFNPRKKTLMFVIRDKGSTPLEKLESILREDLQKIWDSVPKPQAHEQTPLGNFFNVRIIGLSSFQYEKLQFDAEVVSLRQQFYHSTAPRGLADRDTRDVIGASGFSFSVEQVWKVIKENKDLDLPAHKVMVATVRCEQISKEKLSSFAENEDWLRLEEASRGGPVPDFGSKLSSMIQACLSRYEAEAKYFDEGVRISKQKELEEKLLQLVRPVFLSVLASMRSATLDQFKKAFDDALSRGSGFQTAARECTQHYMAIFDKACVGIDIAQAKWDTSWAKEGLQRDMDAHISFLRSDKLSKLFKSHKEKLNDNLASPVAALLDEGNDHTWSSITNLLRRETKHAVSDLSLALSGFEMDEQSKEDMLAELPDHAKAAVERKAREAAARALILMKDRFLRLFFHDSNSMPRVWTGREDIRSITQSSRAASLKLLSVMAAVRLDDEADDIEGILSVALLGDHNTTGSSNSNSLASNTWEQIPSSRTVLSPINCMSLWKKFIQETECIVAQAFSAQEPNVVNNDWIPQTIYASSSALGTVLHGVDLVFSHVRRLR